MAKTQKERGCLQTAQPARYPPITSGALLAELLATTVVEQEEDGRLGSEVRFTYNASISCYYIL
jgi:hypothetical protein